MGAFTCYDLEAAAAVLSAAARRRDGRHPPDRRTRLHATRTARCCWRRCSPPPSASDARACVQLDHCDDLAVIEAALDARRRRRDGRRVGAALRGERRVRAQQRPSWHARTAPGWSASSAASRATRTSPTAVAAGALTDPGRGGRVHGRAPGVDCLAVSIGNVHGVYREPPRLDWARLEAIRALVARPLSLHGASGIPEGWLRRAIAVGHRQGERQHRAAPGVPRGARAETLSVGVLEGARVQRCTPPRPRRSGASSRRSSPCSEGRPT